MSFTLQRSTQHAHSCASMLHRTLWRAGKLYRPSGLVFSRQRYLFTTLSQVWLALLVCRERCINRLTSLCFNAWHMTGLDPEETLLAKMTLRVEVHPDSRPKESEMVDLQHGTSPAPAAASSDVAGRVPEEAGHVAEGREDVPENQHGVNHPAVGAVFQKLEYNSEDGGMTLRVRFCGLVPGFEYKLEVLELSRVGLDTQSVYVKQTRAQHLRCAEACCSTATPLRIMEHLLPDFTENEAAFRFDITLIDAHAGVAGEDAVVCRKSKFMPLTLPPSLLAQIASVEVASSSVGVVTEERAGAGEGAGAAGDEAARVGAGAAGLRVRADMRLTQVTDSRGRAGADGHWQELKAVNSSQ